ncbi:RING/U-box superfamily protein isoform 2 [Hibiscus syriacus]|uniref:RING/U-box superfamily protein isoform 2 n=1 Tax=Hibiscus syriacus TaxID=106335 RepID=A0A6A2ZGY9_HIBSY|nr:RING/U-box superfamily protein isoform 2 [Hibiscus syriacus]
MADIFRCMGKAARVALCAIARHLRLQSDVFNHLLDDTPLPANEVSSSVLVATYSHMSLQNGKGAFGGRKPGTTAEVCDPNGRWYLADAGLASGDMLLITGKALSHSTSSLRPAAFYGASPEYLSGINNGDSNPFQHLASGHHSPLGNAILNCSPVAAAGHVIPQSYVPTSVSQFMDELSAEEDVVCNPSDNTCVCPDLFHFMHDSQLSVRDERRWVTKLIYPRDRAGYTLNNTKRNSELVQLLP